MDRFDKYANVIQGFIYVRRGLMPELLGRVSEYKKCWPFGKVGSGLIGRKK